MCRSYGLPVRDREGRVWEFVVKSWANGTEHRRVYVLEHAAEYIASKRLREGDVVGICADAQGALVVEVGRHQTQRRPAVLCLPRHTRSRDKSP